MKGYFKFPLIYKILIGLIVGMIVGMIAGPAITPVFYCGALKRKMWKGARFWLSLEVLLRTRNLTAKFIF